MNLKLKWLPELESIDRCMVTTKVVKLTIYLFLTKLVFTSLSLQMFLYQHTPYTYTLFHQKCKQQHSDKLLDVNTPWILDQSGHLDHLYLICYKWILQCIAAIHLDLNFRPNFDQNILQNCMFFHGKLFLDQHLQIRSQKI